jgi:transcriptional repressor NrdR
MNCPFCNSEELSVVDKRDISSALIKRRRECLKCKQRFTTYEKVGDVDFFVIKKDGSREKYDREKAKRGIILACKKRPVTLEAIDDLIMKVEHDLRRDGNVEVSSEDIGNTVMKYLKDLDDVAYIRFASIYKAFKTANDFKKEILKLE